MLENATSLYANVKYTAIKELKLVLKCCQINTLYIFYTEKIRLAFEKIFFFFNMK